MKSFEEGRTDNSGVNIEYTLTPLRKLAGVLLLGTSGVIPAHKKEFMETACEITERKVLHPFAFRVHTVSFLCRSHHWNPYCWVCFFLLQHSIGKIVSFLTQAIVCDFLIKYVWYNKVSGYRVRADENGVDQWTLLGKRDPLTPQMFYNVVNNGKKNLSVLNGRHGIKNVIFQEP